MKYLCLVYAEEASLHSLPDSPEDDECQAYADSLAESGHMLGGEPLEPVRSAVTVRVRDGKTSVTDGPFAETKEQLTGFYLVDARDLNEAIRIAENIPPARVGSPTPSPRPPPRPSGSVDSFAESEMKNPNGTSQTLKRRKQRAWVSWW